MYVTLFGDRRGTLPAGWINETIIALLGDWNWYLPHWLHWLPTLSHGAETSTPVTTDKAREPARA